MRGKYLFIKTYDKSDEEALVRSGLDVSFQSVDLTFDVTPNFQVQIL